MAAIGSNLACVGLDVPDVSAFEALLLAVLPDAVPVGAADGLEVRRWEDPSGARLAITTRDRSIEGVMPSFAGSPGAELGDVALLAGDVCRADVLVDGEVATRLAIALEEGYLLAGRTAGGRASIVALAKALEVFPDAAAYEASPASLLVPDADPDEPRPETLPDGVRWPVRLGSESFISTGLFAAEAGTPGVASPEARLAGIVLASERRRSERTGQAFDVLRVRTVGFEADLCLPADASGPPAAPGSIVAGDVNLMGSLPAILDLPPEPSRRRVRLPWRRGS